jgi:BirA family transcriptional regulator, biotin operon repressor / biotin---[acetyl-CoA-carboxylase] ligase
MALDLRQLTERLPHTPIHYFPTIDSTMVEATRLAAEGAPHGTLVIADEQIAGVGRFGRTWHSEANDGIYCSLVLRLPLPASAVAVATLALGLATREAIQLTTGLPCDLRWPNDVLVGDDKVAGILAQLLDSRIVAGVGINVNQTSLPDGLRTPATSLRLAAGGAVFAREPIVAALVNEIEEFCTILVQQGPSAILEAFAASSSYIVNRRVVYEGETGFERGTTAGLDANGFLLVRDDAGQLSTVYTGGVRPDSES